MSNQVKIFTDALYELVAIQNISLVQSLEMMSVEQKSEMSKACLSIKKELLRGSPFSTALKTSRYFNFDNVYISFIGFSEVTGNLSQTLCFLKKRCERMESSKQKLIDASIYPGFVVLMAIAVCFFIWKMNFGKMAGSMEGLLTSICMLFFICICVFWIIYLNLKEDKLYEAFLAVGFLIKSGVNVSNAMDAGVIIAGPGSKYGIYFQKAKKRLEYGMDVFSAFYELQFDSKLKNIIYFAKMGGSKSDVFEKIAIKIGLEDEKRKNRTLKLVEPIFIGITGVFLLVLMVTYFMPMMTDTSWLSL